MIGILVLLGGICLFAGIITAFDVITRRRDRRDAQRTR